jgi:hypothetical protein
MQQPLLRTFLIGSGVLPALLMAVALLFALLLGSLPNGVQFQATLNLAFLQILWQDNPWATLKLVLVNKPLVVVEHLDQRTGLQVWGIFYFAGTLLIYLLVSAFTAWHWRRLTNSTAKQRVLFAAGAAAMLIGVTYLRRAECCTSGPGWVLDTWLLAKVYTPGPAAVNWMHFYENARPWLPAVQTGMLVGGTAMLYWWYLSATKTAIRHAA